MPLDKHDPELAGLEAALAALAPMPDRINRDALLFRAGQASIPGRGWAWPIATAALGVVSVVLAGVVAFRLSPSPAERVIVVKAPQPAPSAPPTQFAGPPASEPEPGPASLGEIASGSSPMTYLQLQKQVLRWGLDGVPAMHGAPPPTTLPMTRDHLLGTPAEPTPSPSFLFLAAFFQ
jgi:hypothetical protein